MLHEGGHLDFNYCAYEFFLSRFVVCSDCEGHKHADFPHFNFRQPLGTLIWHPHAHFDPFWQIVEREGLLSAEDWGELTDEVDKAPQISVSEILFELKSMFPGAPSGLLLEAAQSCNSVDEAVAQIISPARIPYGEFPSQSQSIGATSGSLEAAE